MSMPGRLILHPHPREHAQVMPRKRSAIIINAMPLERSTPPRRQKRTRSARRGKPPFVALIVLGILAIWFAFGLAALAGYLRLPFWG